MAFAAFPRRRKLNFSITKENWKKRTLNDQKNSFSAIFLPFFAFLLDKTVHMAPKKLVDVCYSTWSLYRNVWWREAGAKLLLNQEKQQKTVFFSFFCIFLPDKLPNSQKNPENVVFEILAYIYTLGYLLS